MNENNSWIENELKAVNFGDKRLNERLINVASSMSKSPSLPLNQVADDWHALKASYRLFDNKKVTPEKIIKPHISNT